MSQEILVNVTPREVRVALLENRFLQEIYIERHAQRGLISNIYKGRIHRLLPGMQAAFVDIGLDRKGFLHLNDLAGHENDSHADIRELLRVGQELLVQVYKNPLGSKGARLTTQFSIPSRYLVLTPYLHEINTSQKLADEAERQRLVSMITPGPCGGYIFRTAAEGVSQAEIIADQKFLTTLWSHIIEQEKSAKTGEMVYEDISLVLRVLRDFAGNDVEKIRIDDQNTAQKMRDFAKKYIPQLVDRIEYYDQARPLFEVHAVEDELQKALQRKISLKSGGHLVLDQTEAMTTIDVNTGSYVGRNNLEQTAWETNVEAVAAIAHQVRLRNLGGIIIIDFIDMADPSQRAELIKLLNTALAKDNARAQVSELSSLGLVQMTRKRTRESLENTLCVPCPLCHKRGSIKSLATICYEIFREIKRVEQMYPWSGFVVVAAQNVVNCLLEEESAMLAALETQLGKPIKFRVESSFTQEHYDILPMSEGNHKA